MKEETLNFQKAFDIDFQAKNVPLPISAPNKRSDFNIGFKFFFSADPTKAGILEQICCSSVPLWWEDVEEFSTLETLVFMVYNHVSNS